VAEFFLRLLAGPWTAVPAITVLCVAALYAGAGLGASWDRLTAAAVVAAARVPSWKRRAAKSHSHKHRLVKGVPHCAAPTTTTTTSGGTR
jgi:hypothetical protein